MYIVGTLLYSIPIQDYTQQHRYIRDNIHLSLFMTFNMSASSIELNWKFFFAPQHQNKHTKPIHEDVYTDIHTGTYFT